MLDDAQVRLAAFTFLEEQQRLAGDEGVLPRKVLAEGFVYEGQRVPLMGPQGIFKPRVYATSRSASRPWRWWRVRRALTMTHSVKTVFFGIDIEALTRGTTKTSVFGLPCSAGYRFRLVTCSARAM